MKAIIADERTQLVTTYKKLLANSADIRESDDIKRLRDYLSTVANLNLKELKAENYTRLQHIIEVVNVVVDEIGLGRVAAICAILYEVMQHNTIDRNDVARLFGEQTATVVDGLQKVCELYQRGTIIADDNFRKLLFTFAQDVRVILVILADRLTLMRHLRQFPQEDQLRIGTEVGQLYAPMAHRMGLYGMKSEMEDLSMKYTNREVYLDIARKLNETKRSRDAYIDNFIAPLRQRLDATGMNYEMKGRTKTISSIYNKLKKSHVDIEGIYDLFAIRIIIDCPLDMEKAACWRAYSIVTDLYQPNPARLKDWISVPKGNGYESLHITVLGPQNRWVEVQIRTTRMDEVAEKGFAAHWKYKGIKTEQSMEKWLSNIREVLENPELTTVDFIEDFKLNLYDKEVFAFTPKGELRRLAKGATVLDFAFDIHSKIGCHCVGAIVNERNVSIKYVIQNGDQVEILTSPRQEPKQDWIPIVTTGHARSKLRQALKEKLFKQSEVGREMLERRFKNWKIEFTDTLLHDMMHRFGYKDINIFLSDVGENKVQPQQIKSFVDDQLREEQEKLPEKTVSAENYYHRDDSKTDSSRNILRIDSSLTDIEFTLAKCCSPIIGDNIFAFITASGGLKVHRIGCPNEAEMRRKFPYRIQAAEWVGSAGNLTPVVMRITGSDDIGILANITQLLTKDGSLRVRSINVNSTEGGFEGDVTVLIASEASLDNVVKKIKTVRGVYNVEFLDNTAH